MNKSPEYVAIGHITVDRLADGEAIGGSSIYSSLTAQRIGYRAGVISAHSKGAHRKNFLPGNVAYHTIRSPETTTFVNAYMDGDRTQVIRKTASPIGPQDIPEYWLSAKMVHVCPVADEVDPEVVRLFKNAVVCVSPQGWMRSWDKNGRITKKGWSTASYVLPYTDILTFSDEDISGFESSITYYVKNCRIVVQTHGKRGVTLYSKGRSVHYPAFKTSEHDPTGAGDVFAASFLVRYHETGDPYESTEFAVAAASHAVEKRGIFGVPASRERVEDRMHKYMNPKRLAKLKTGHMGKYAKPGRIAPKAGLSAAARRTTGEIAPLPERMGKNREDDFYA